MVSMHIDSALIHAKHTAAFDCLAEMYGLMVEVAEAAASGRGRANLDLLYHLNKRKLQSV